MPNQTVDLDWLDTQCQVYEENWTSDRAGPEAVIAFALESLQTTDERLPLLLGPLVEVDIERIWMGWRTQVLKQIEQRSGLEWSNLLASVPKLGDYLAAIASLHVKFSMQESLLRTEYRARQEWGDAPRWDIIASPWPFLSRHFSNPARHRVEIQSEEFTTPRAFDLCGLTEFGRQRTTDDAAGVIVHTENKSRIIVAGRTQAMISRRQFSLQILSTNYAILTNQSETNPLQINSKKKLAFEEAAVIQLPSALRFQDLVLRFS